jgi:NADH:ubiquinone oxidoreductase subunit K
MLIGSQVMTNDATIQIIFFLQNYKKRKLEMFAFCVITFEPIKRLRPVQHLKMTI